MAPSVSVASLLCLLGLAALALPSAVRGAVSVRKLKRGHDELLKSSTMPLTQLDSSLESRLKETPAAERLSTALKTVYKDGSVSEDEAKSLVFLFSNMPQRDLEDEKVANLEFLIEHIRLALHARSTYPWASESAVPWETFLNDVLPFAVFDEPREPWRPLMLEAMQRIVQPFVKSYTHTPQQFTTLINTINTQLWAAFGEPHIIFVSDRTPEIMSPSQVLTARNASCTGLSLFLTFALRSVGIPARVAGVPVWNTETGGNHNWVEVMGPDGWHFTGAHEPVDAGLDRGWFSPEPVSKALPATPSDRLHAVYASAYNKAAGATTDPSFSLYFPLGWRLEVDWVPAVDVTERYAPQPPSFTKELQQ